MARRPTDHTAALLAAAERKRLDAERRRTLERQAKAARQRQAIAYGTIVLEITGTLFDVDAFAGVMLDILALIRKHPERMEVWREDGRGFFRPSVRGERPAGADTPGTKPTSKRGNGHAKPAAAPDGSTPPDAADLLQNLGLLRTRPGPTAEG